MAHDAIGVAAKEFMCIGAKPPQDHPHVFLDMGGDDEIVCPYCSTLYRFRANLKGTMSDPPDCQWLPDPEDAMA